MRITVTDNEGVVCCTNNLNKAQAAALLSLTQDTAFGGRELPEAAFEEADVDYAYDLLGDIRTACFNEIVPAADDSAA